ncbi:MAG: enoyl-CoA hydratase-related protein, partial [Bacteroidota bacterium]
SPQDGYRLGLINEVVEPGSARAVALRWATKMAENAPISVQQSLRVVDTLASATDEEAWALTNDARRVIGQSEDSKEGVQAFFEKRPPRWTGR